MVLKSFPVFHDKNKHDLSRCPDDADVDDPDVRMLPISMGALQFTVSWEWANITFGAWKRDHFFAVFELNQMRLFSGFQLAMILDMACDAM